MIDECDGAGGVCADDRIGDGVEGDLGAFLFQKQRVFHALALNRIADRAQHRAQIQLAFDEIVLRAGVQGLRRQCIVVTAGHHHQWHVGRRGARHADRLDAAGIG